MTIRKNWRNKIVAAFLGIILALSLMPQTAFAIDPMEVGADVQLTLNYYGDDGTPIVGAEFKLYKVADADKFAEFTPVNEFADYMVDYPEDINDLDASGWKTLAETLAIYVERDQIEPIDQAVTDEQGKIIFPNNATELTTGLYLVTGETFTYQYKVYEPEATLVSLPSRDELDNWIYEWEISPKSEWATEMTEVKVVKTWKDSNDSAKKRPDEIKVQLLKEGKVYDTVTLNKDNNWRYTWTDLEASYEWAVVEKETINGYKVTIERDGETFTLTNTYKTPTTPGKTTGKLPQTGMLWWPVPVLAGAGMLFFMIGWTKRRKES